MSNRIQEMKGLFIQKYNYCHISEEVIQVCINESEIENHLLTPAGKDIFEQRVMRWMLREHVSYFKDLIPKTYPQI